MAYDSSDPRSSLASAPVASSPSSIADADFVNFHDVEPSVAASGQKTWLVRGQNFVVSYTEVNGAAEFLREEQQDEWVLLVPGSGLEAVSLEVGTEELAIQSKSIAFVPPGSSRLRVKGTGQLVRLFTLKAGDLMQGALNSESYLVDHPNVTPFSPWPTADGDPRVHVYSLDVPPAEGRFGRIFRCSTFMVNFLDPTVGPRDTARMSPHTHDDFEQCSLAVEGDYYHHIRWPWTTNKNEWREDQHRHCPSPSVVVIPPPAIHTSQAVDRGINQLVDIFCPPRVDFSAKPGWVLNAADYPTEYDR